MAHSTYCSDVRGNPYRRATTRYRIPDRVAINERPDTVQQKRFYGDWELDLMQGHDIKAYILVAVKRKSMFTCLAAVPNKKADGISELLISLLWPFKVRTLTMDNGLEFSQHLAMAKA